MHFLIIFIIGNLAFQFTFLIVRLAVFYFKSFIKCPNRKLLIFTTHIHKLAEQCLQEPKFSLKLPPKLLPYLFWPLSILSKIGFKSWPKWKETALSPIFTKAIQIASRLPSRKNMESLLCGKETSPKFFCHLPVSAFPWLPETTEKNKSLESTSPRLPKEFNTLSISVILQAYSPLLRALSLHTHFSTLTSDFSPIKSHR